MGCATACGNCRGGTATTPLPPGGTGPQKIIATVLDEAHKRQVEEVMDTLQEGPEGLYKRPPYGLRARRL